MVERVAGCGIVATNPVGRMVGNFFIRLTRPPYPTRLFSGRDEAAAWLLEQVPH